jgi:EAL domain-containing protein (putative c-di-GMP-specific phosphodiesterase class I)/GGDEF domain-containing protein
MSRELRQGLAHWHARLGTALLRTEVLALFPILILLAYQTGREGAVIATAMALPTLLALRNIGGAMAHPMHTSGDRRPNRDTMAAMLDRIAAMAGMDTACFVLALDDREALVTRWGRDTALALHDRCRLRLEGSLRRGDLLADLGEGRFGVVLHPVEVARLGIREGIAARLCAVVAEPLIVGDATLRLTASVGHAALRQGGADPASTLTGAESALEEALLAGPNSIRAHVPGRALTRPGEDPLAEEVAEALTSGAIRPWFQPQVDAVTGRVTGFEALARWHHPRLGLLGPARFLDAVAEAGRMEALGVAMRRHALAALATWDRHGADDITVSVNACADELRSPTYAEQVAWDLDTHDIAPSRLAIEVLETVAATARDDSIVATLGALRGQGVAIELDDFGVGQASLLAIRRYGVRRIKIDRSFVIGVDADGEQKAMVGAILSMAREMGIEALAEGVETEEERATLTAMGCAALQGFLIGKPMPLAETLRWLASREAGRSDGPAERALRPAQ